MALSGTYPSFSFVFLMIMEHFHLEEVLVKFLGGTKHLWKFVKKFFLEVFLPYNYYIIITVYTSQQGKRK